MSLRPPQSHHESAVGKAPLSVLEYELMAERADSLGRAGLKAEAALERLKDCPEIELEDRLDAAAEAAQVGLENLH